MAQVFISYSRRDLTFVSQLISDLKETGVDVWYDLSGLEGGSRWRIEIQNAIQNSEYVIVVLSPDSVKSEWVEREYMYAENLKKKVLPIMYRECELPLGFLNLNFIDVQGANYARNFEKITRFLNTSSLPLPSLERNSRKKRQNVASFALVGVVVVLGVSTMFLLFNNARPRDRVPDSNDTNTPAQIILPPTSSSETDMETATEPPTSIPPTATITEPPPPAGVMNPSSPLPVDIGNQAVFLQTAAGSNMSDHWTELRDSHATDPKALVFAMPHFSDATKIYNRRFLAAWYNGLRWTIVNQDLATMRHNSEFHVRIVGRGENAFVHTAAPSNSENSWTVIEPPVLDPNALVFVMPTWSLDGKQMTVKQNHPIGVWYTGSRWAVINLDGAEMLEGTAFNIQVLNQSANAFVHRAGSTNITNNWTVIDEHELEMAADKLVFVTPRGAPDGTMVNNTRPIGVWLFGSQWTIFNQLEDRQSAPTDKDAMPEGAEFNILVLDQEVTTAP
jgi:hypothetical protein